MVDRRASREAVLKAVRTLTGKRDIHTLFNTHWHYDQTGSNTELGPAGTRIIAHENTRLWLGTVIDSKWEHRTYSPLPPKARPNQTFYTTASLEFGGEKIDYGYMPQAHTDGDIYVYFRKADVLVGADVLAAGAWPILDYSTNGWIGGMVNGTQALLDMSGPATKYIAGKGAALNAGTGAGRKRHAHHHEAATVKTAGAGHERAGHARRRARQ